MREALLRVCNLILIIVAHLRRVETAFSRFSLGINSTSRISLERRSSGSSLNRVVCIYIYTYMRVGNTRTLDVLQDLFAVPRVNTSVNKIIGEAARQIFLRCKYDSQSQGWTDISKFPGRRENLGSWLARKFESSRVSLPNAHNLCYTASGSFYQVHS